MIVVKNNQELLKAIKRAKKFETIIFDEIPMGMSSMALRLTKQIDEGLKNNSKKLNLPKGLSNDVAIIILNVYKKLGSITRCKTVEDFGIYRAYMATECDKLLREKDEKIKTLIEYLENKTLIFDERCKCCQRNKKELEGRNNAP